MRYVDFFTDEYLKLEFSGDSASVLAATAELHV